jgi:nicotinamidase/pyrazinamidase
MEQVLFWDVDTQIDFMLRGRPLYVQGAEKLLDRLGALTRYAHEAGIRVAGSEDSHGPSDPEISSEPDWVSTFPPHCMAGTEGQRRVAETSPRDPLYVESAPLPRDDLARRVEGHRGEIYFRKQTFDAFRNPNVEPVLDLLRPSAVVVYGVARDICVRFAVEGFLRRGREEVFAVSDATRALDHARGDELLEAWRARGVRVLTTAEVLAGAAGRGQRGAA